MGLSNILRRYLKRKLKPLEVRERGSARGEELHSTKPKKPTRAFASSHSGAYDKNLHPTVKDSHGGDWQPNQYKTTSSDQRNDHGGDYRPILQINTRLLKLSNQTQLLVTTVKLTHEESIYRGGDISTKRLLLMSSPSPRENLNHVNPIVTANFQCSAFRYCKRCYLPFVWIGKTWHTDSQ